MQISQIFINLINFESLACLFFFLMSSIIVFHLERGDGIGRQEITWYIVVYKMTVLAKRKNKEVSEVSVQAFKPRQLSYSPFLLTSYFEMLIL